MYNVFDHKVNAMFYCIQTHVNKLPLTVYNDVWKSYFVSYVGEQYLVKHRLVAMSSNARFILLLYTCDRSFTHDSVVGVDINFCVVNYTLHFIH